ncbi:MAG: sulfotransferase, partial [Pirellulaceae bacterium]|nr:sulfotransferase [Pirellulaceae bacterium]
MNSTQPARRPTAGSVDKQDRPTVIYIMGYGRSGSTILDILLNQHDDVISVGALANIYEWLLRKEACGCAEKVEACSFWANVCERTLDVADEAELSERRDLQSAVESIRRYPALALGWSSKRRTADYAAEMERLFAAIAETSESRFVVDSSKSAHDCTGRPLALFRHTRLDVKIIHLVRDGRGVAWSVMKGAGSQERKRRFTRPSLNFLRAVAGWTLANFCALVTTR